MNDLFLKQQPYNECQINGIRQYYDACSRSSLEEAKEYYKDFDYIGSGYITYHNNTKNVWKQLTHFFIKKGQ